MADYGYLRDVLDYSTETGLFYWRERVSGIYISSSRVKQWNAQYAGHPALEYVDKWGYKTGQVLGVAWLAHRAAWAWVHNYLGPLQIDHINHIKEDNRISNLRLVTPSENLKNLSVAKAKNGLPLGVRFNKRDKRWIAAIGVHGKTKHLGYFESFDAAVLARREAEVQFGYHENHGK